MKSRWWIIGVVGALCGAVFSSFVQASTVITFSSQFTSFQDARGDFWRSLIAEFNESQGEIRVEIVAGGGSVAEQNERMVTWIAAGQAPDVFEFHGANFGAWASQGFLADLEPFLERDPEIALSDFYPTVIEMYKRTGNGRLYALPLQIQVYLMEYNLDLFDAGGISYPPTSWDDPSWNWDSFVEVGKKLTLDRTGDGVPDQYGFQARRDVTGGLLTYIWQAGGDVVDAAGNFTFNSPESLRGLQYLIDLRHVHGIATTGGFPHTAAMRISVPAGYPALKTNFPGVRWDLAPLPRGPVRSATILGSTPMSISAFSEHPEAAWRFYKYLVSSETLQRIITQADHVPVRRSVVESPAFRAIDIPPSYFVAADAVEYAYLANERGPNWTQIAQILQSAVDRAWEGVVSIENAVEEVRATVEALLREGWERQAP